MRVRECVQMTYEHEQLSSRQSAAIVIHVRASICHSQVAYVWIVVSQLYVSKVACHYISNNFHAMVFAWIHNAMCVQAIVMVWSLH